MHCLLKEDDDPSGQIPAGGLGHVDKFHAARLADSRKIIHEMLNELPEAAQAAGGVAFDALGVDRGGNYWVSPTGGFREMTIERLVQLGVAAGMMECELPHTSWPRYPSVRVKK